MRQSRSEDPNWNNEVDSIQDWYNRAYNRAGAKQHGSTVFTSLHGGKTPIQAEFVVREKRTVDLSGLGRLPSEEYVRLTKTLERQLAEYHKTGDIANKLDIFQLLSEAAPTGGEIATKATVDVWTRKIIDCLKFVEIDQHWIGSREAGPDKGFAVFEQAFSSEGGRNHKTEILG